MDRDVAKHPLADSLQAFSLGNLDAASAEAVFPHVE